MASRSKGRLAPKDRPFRPAGFMVVESDSQRILRHTRKKRIAKKQYKAESACYFDAPDAVHLYATTSALIRDLERFQSVYEPEDWVMVRERYADVATQRDEDG